MGPLPATTTQPDGLPLTTVAQTLGDLAAHTSGHRLERLLERAEHLRLLDTSSLAEQFGRRGGRRLERALRAVATHDVGVTRSALEERFLEEVARAGLERPEVDPRGGPFLVDFVWGEARLIAETGGGTPRW